MEEFNLYIEILYKDKYTRNPIDFKGYKYTTYIIM